jgi:hypothetical protein
MAKRLELRMIWIPPALICDWHCFKFHKNLNLILRKPPDYRHPPIRYPRSARLKSLVRGKSKLKPVNPAPQLGFLCGGPGMAPRPHTIAPPATPAFAAQYPFIAARRPSLFWINPIRDTLGYSKVLFSQTL